MEYTKEQFDKLPKWAQSQIKRLEMRLGEANKELERINLNPESNVVVGSHFQKPIKYLEQDERISFLFGDNYIEVTPIENGIRIHTNGLSKKEMLIKPLVGNAIIVKLIDEK